MSGYYLTELAATQRDWLATRQATIARNVANASTPGYVRHDVKPFEEVLSRSDVVLTGSHPAHIGAPEGGRARVVLESRQGWERSHSGNDVVVEQEMLNAAEVSRQFTLNVNITRSIHEMMLAGLKG
jgi:flagellar basal-body rod protein FlgB